MPALFFKLAFVVALILVGLAGFALLTLLSPTVFRWRAQKMSWSFIDPGVLPLIWFCCFEISREGYFSALWYGILFGWMMRPSKVNVALKRSQSGADLVLLGVVGTIGILIYFSLLQRVLGPVGVFLLKPLVLLPASFAILMLLVWKSARAAHSASTAQP